MLDASGLGRLAQLVHQHLYDGTLKARRYISLVLLDEVRVFSHPIPQLIKKRCFQSAEAIVETGYMWLGEFISLGIALACQLVDDGSAGIAQPHHLRTFVYRLTRGIIDGLTEYLHAVVSLHLHNLRVASTDQQAKEGERRCRLVIVVLLDEMGHDMALQVVHIYQGYAQCPCEALGETHAHEQRPHQSWSASEGHCRELLLGHSSPFQSLVNHRHHILLMGSGSQFRHHPAIFAMNILRRRHITQQHPVFEHSRRSVIAATLQS